MNKPNKGTKFRYTDGCFNPLGDNTEIVLHCENEHEDRPTQTLVIVLKEQNVEDQIELLINQMRIEEAIEIFNTRLSKHTERYIRFKEKFFLDVGWMCLLHG